MYMETYIVYTIYMVLRKVGGVYEMCNGYDCTHAIVATIVGIHT